MKQRLMDAPLGTILFNVAGQQGAIVMEGDFRNWLCRFHPDGGLVTVRELGASDFRDYARLFDQKADHLYEVGDGHAYGQYSLKHDIARRRADNLRKKEARGAEAP